MGVLDNPVFPEIDLSPSGAEPAERRPILQRVCEALGVILADNPNGTLAFRDELVSLLKTLDREEGKVSTIGHANVSSHVAK